MRTYDVCVIGAGGVVGSAIMRHLAQQGLKVIALEKHSGPAQETSGASSGVIHSGFHEMAGTLKSELAREGSEALMAYAGEQEVPLLQTGMLIALPHDAFSAGLWQETGALWRLWRGGRRQKIAFRWILTKSSIHEIAPIEAIGGIFIPSVCVIDVVQLVQSFQRDAIERGVEIRYDSPVREIGTEEDSYIVCTATEEFRTSALINSAGLQACEISMMARGPSYAVEFIRGEYYAFRGGIDRWGIRTLIYPAMPARSKSKGIHFGPRTDGRLFLGPNAVRLPDGTGSVREQTPKEIFLQSARKFLPQIVPDDLEWSHAGIRPKYTRPDGVSDFLIRLERRRPALINLIGIDSPGLSSCMAIARHVGNLLQLHAVPERRMAVRR